MTNRPLHAALGVLAALVGVAAGHLVAALGVPSASPVLAVGSTVVDLAPTPLKEWAIRTFGAADKTVLVGSVLVVALVLAAVAGLLARRRLAAGAAVLVGLVALAGVAALTRPGAGAVDVLPALATALAGVGALTWLHRSAVAPGPAPDRRAPDDTAPDRRGVLVAAGFLGLSAVVLGGAGRWVTALRTRPVDVLVPAATDPVAPLAAGLEERIPGITPFRTPTADFYRIDTRLSLPTVNLDGWRLSIDGDVGREVSFGYDELAAMPLIERDITLTCVSNDVGGSYLGGARWRGVPLQALLDRAGLDATRADQILSTDVDGMTISTPLDLATDGRDAMVALGMNGAALPREHGFPARLVVPGLYGFIGATKWITRMTLTTYAAQDAYWTQREWATDAPVKMSSRIDVPRPFTTIQPGRTVIGGIAWAQHLGGVAQVEVRVDGGAWQQARLGPGAGQDYWRQWYLPWSATTGRHMLSVRAVDGQGRRQSAARVAPFPDGSSGVQQVLVDVS